MNGSINEICLLSLNQTQQHGQTQILLQCTTIDYEESEQNQTIPHNILTQINIGVQGEVRVQIANNDYLKRNIRRWRQATKAAPTPSTINFPVVSDLYYRTTRDKYFFTYGFKQRYKTDIVFADNIHKILASAFLEPNQVINGFELLCSDLGDEYQEVLDCIEDNYIGRARGWSRRPATFPIHFWNMVVHVKNNMYRKTIRLKHGTES
ncbi:unnamed protein product [Rotaria magnacalcarata]|uniref:Uncharacterized protein n=1 Tax=Rotaria magnacalcarata TaxID=392030 RepID=A0A816XTX2_9BILA|nr:unnamed protein product [Rotaria magnacalcarata]